jgi:hypothetical protein
VDWIHLAQDWDRWQALVKTVITLRLHKISDWWLLKDDLAPWSYKKIIIIITVS